MFSFLFLLETLWLRTSSRSTESSTFWSSSPLVPATFEFTEQLEAKRQEGDISQTNGDLITTMGNKSVQREMT